MPSFSAHKKKNLSLSNNSMLNRHHPRDTGFSLLEVLIASTVFSFGLAGFAALLLTSITDSAQARIQGVAAIAAVNLAEQIRLYPTALSRYLEPPETISKICAGNHPCTPKEQADYDFRLWQLELADRIPNARGLVCRDETPMDGIKGNNHCDGTGPLVIKIFWNGGRHNSPDGTNDQRFTMEIS